MEQVDGTLQTNLDREKIEIDKKRLELEAARLKLDSGFLRANASAIIAFLASLTVVLVSTISGIFSSANQKATDDAKIALEQTTEDAKIALQKTQNEFTQEMALASFVFDHSDLIYGTQEDKTKFINLANIAWGTQFANDLIGRASLLNQNSDSNLQWVSLKNKLDDLAPKIEGKWTCDVKCQPATTSASVARDGWSLTFTNEVGAVSSGTILGPDRVVALDWGSGLRATIQDDGKTLIWENGSIWKKS